MYSLSIRKCTSPSLLAPRLKIQIKFYYPAGDRTTDLLNQRQICYHLSQRGEQNINVNPTKYPLVGLLSLELLMHPLYFESLGLNYERKGSFVVRMCLSGWMVERQYVKLEFWDSNPSLEKFVSLFPGFSNLRLKWPNDMFRNASFILKLIFIIFAFHQTPFH